MKLHRLIVGFFGSLSHFAIGHPRRVLALAALVTLAVAPGVLRLKLRTDAHALVSPNASEVVYDQSIRDKFGIEDQIVVLVRAGHPDGVFNPGTIQLVRDLTAEFARMPGIKSSNVMSLAAEPSFRIQPGTLIHETLLERPLKTKAELDRLRDDLQRIRLYTSTLVSSNGQCAAILIGTPPGGDRTQLYERILGIIAAHPAGADYITVTGAPVAEALLGIHILEDLGVPRALLGTSTRGRTGRPEAQIPGTTEPPHVGSYSSEGDSREWKMPGSFYELQLLLARKIGLVPIAVAVMMLVFLVSFRKGLATLLPLPEVATTLLFVFGLMGWCGVPVYLTIAVMPVLLVAMCVTDEIHVFSRYFALLRERPGVDHVQLVRETADEMVCPVVNTTLTTAIGFVSFAFSPLGPVQAFGIFTAVGVLFSLFYSLTVIPAMLTLIEPKSLVKSKIRNPKSERSPKAKIRSSGGGPGLQTGNTRPAEKVCVGIRFSDFFRISDFSLGAWFARLAASVVRHRWWVVGLLLVVTALTPLGLRRLVVQDSWIDGFAPESEFRRATRLVNEGFHGMHLLFVSFDAPKTIRAELPASALTLDGINLPAALVGNPAVVAGSLITLSIVPGATNAAARAPLRTRIEMAARRGESIVTRFPPSSAFTNFGAATFQSPRAGAWGDRNVAPPNGTIRIEVVAQTHLQPEVIRATAELAAFLRERGPYAVGGVLGPADYLSTSRFMVRPSDPNARVLPDDAGEIKLLWDYYRIARGPHRLRQVVDTNYWQSLTTVFLKNGNFIDTAKLLAEVRAYEREQLAPKGIKLGFAGDVAVSQSLITGIVRTQLQSLVWSLVGIYLVTALLGRSWRWGVYCVLPSTLAVLVNFAVMGWFGIPLGVATSMFAGMTLGIGVDFAIHLLEGYGLARAEGADGAGALARAMALTGPPVLINTVAVSLGFGVLILSQVPANARLGLLVVLGLVDCLIASLLILPALLHWWPLQEQRAEIRNPNLELRSKSE